MQYRHTAYPSAWLAGVAGFAYSIFFVLSTRGGGPIAVGTAAGLLLIGGIVGATALLGLYERLRGAAGVYALWALIFGLAGAFAATLHGGFDLANVINPPGGENTLPSQVDPRGLGTFGLAGISILAFAFLMARDSSFPPGLALLGYASGVLLLLVYLSRLTILSPSNPLVLGPAALEGLVVNPVWYVWLGFVLRGPAARA